MPSRSLAFLVFVAAVGAALGQPASQPTTRAASDGVARVLRHVPDGAQLVIIVPNVEQFADGLRAFVKSIGIPGVKGFTARELISEPLGAPAEALRLDAPIAVAMTAGRDEIVVIGLLAAGTSQPTSPSPRSLAGAALRDFGDEGLLAMTDDGVAIIARDEAAARGTIEARGELGRSIDAALTDRIRDHQLLVYVDVPAWHERVEMAIDLITQTSMMGLSVAGPEAANAMRVQRWAFDEARALLGEIQTYVAGASLDADGVRYTDRVLVRTDGQLAKYLAGVKPFDRDLLRGLHAERPAAVFGMEWQTAPDVATVEEVMFDTLLATDELKQRLGEDRLRSAIDRIKSAHRRLTGYNGAFDLVKGGQGMTMSGLYLTDQADEHCNDIRTLFKNNPEFLCAWASFPQGCSVEFSTDTCQRVQADVFRFSVPHSGSPIEAAMEAMYGATPAYMFAPTPRGTAYYVGAADGGHDTMQRLIADGPGPALSDDPHIRAVLDRLSPHPQLVMLLDIRRMIELSMRMTKAMGMPAPKFEMAGEPLAYSAYALYLQPSEVRQEMILPSTPIRQIIQEFSRMESDALESQPSKP